MPVKQNPYHALTHTWLHEATKDPPWLCASWRTTPGLRCAPPWLPLLNEIFPLHGVLQYPVSEKTVTQILEKT